MLWKNISDILWRNLAAVSLLFPDLFFDLQTHLIVFLISWLCPFDVLGKPVSFAKFTVPVNQFAFPPVIPIPDGTKQMVQTVSRAFYSYRKLAGITFSYSAVIPAPFYSYAISCSITIPDWNCISILSAEITLIPAISLLTKSLSNSGIWQVLALMKASMSFTRCS